MYLQDASAEDDPNLSFSWSLRAFCLSRWALIYICLSWASIHLSKVFPFRFSEFLVDAWRPTEDSWCTRSQLKMQPYSQLAFPINQCGENSALSCWSFLCKAHVSLQGLSGYWFCQFASITVQKQRPCAHNINSWKRRDIYHSSGSG